MTYFTVELLQTINDWQAGAIDKKINGNYHPTKKRDIGNKLKNYVENIPAKFRTYNGVCYRKFHSSDNLKLGLEEIINEKYSSWTSNYKIAKSDNFLQKEYNTKHIGIIYKKKVTVSDNCVLLNLEALYTDIDFCNACDTYKEHIEDFDEGIGKYGDSQHEIILIDTNFSIDDIVAYRGKGNNSEKFIQNYFPNISKEEKQYLKNYPNINKKKWIDGENAVCRLRCIQKALSHEVHKKYQRPQYISMDRQELIEWKKLMENRTL